MLRQRHEYRAGKDGYVSEFTQFMESLLARHPEIAKDQHEGWNTFWDHQVDFDALEKAKEDNVPFDDHLGTISRPD